MPASGYEPPEPCFGTRGRKPVSVEFSADGWETPGFSFADYSAAHIYKKRLCNGRKKPSPEWVFNAQFREVLARYCERRAHIAVPLNGTPAERIGYATYVLRLKLPALRATMDKLCHELFGLKQRKENPARQYKLEQLIEAADSQIITVRRGPAAVAAAVAYQYFNLGYESVAVAAALDLKPPTVRQTIFRLQRVAKEQQERTACRDAKPQKAETPETPEQRERRLAKMRERNAARQAAKPPRFCIICGAVVGKWRKKSCSKACQQVRSRAVRRLREGSNPRVPVYLCSAACEKIRRRSLRAGNGFGTDVQTAKNSAEGSRSYEKYLETCSRAEVDPMTRERWELLQK